MNSLPEELLQDILFRLPITSLIRCKSVCKPWNSFIKTSSFIGAHLSRTINNHKPSRFLLYGGRLYDPPYITFEGINFDSLKFIGPDNARASSLVNDHASSEDNIHDFNEFCNIDFQLDLLVRSWNNTFGVPSLSVAGVCNGLLCLADYGNRENNNNYIVWNPLIRKAVMLPNPSVTLSDSDGFFDDAIGLGFDAQTNDYKVVRMISLEFNGDNPIVVEVYSLAMGSWRILGSDVVPWCKKISFANATTFLNGAIHWGVGFPHYFSILTFDVSSEVFGEIPVPESLEEMDRMTLEPVVSVSGDGKSLSMFCRYFDKEKDEILEIWVMKEYGLHESWTRLITLSAQRSSVDQQLQRVQPLCFKNSEEVLVLSWNWNHRTDMLASLDLVSQQINNHGKFKFHYCKAYPYEESLGLLDMDNAVSCSEEELVSYHNDPSLVKKEVVSNRRRRGQIARLAARFFCFTI